MKNFKKLHHWYERYTVGKSKEILSNEIIELGLSDKEWAVRAVFMGRKDFQISEAQIARAIQDESPMVKIALVRRRDVIFSESQVRQLENDPWPLVREIFAENDKKCHNLVEEKESVTPWWQLIPFSLAT